VQVPGDERRDRAAKMNHGSFAACRSAKTKRRGANGRGAETAVQSDVTAAQRTGFDNLCDALRLTAWLTNFKDSPIRKPPAVGTSITCHHGRSTEKCISARESR
jgi:hypothetical protein